MGTEPGQPSCPRPEANVRSLKLKQKGHPVTKVPIMYRSDAIIYTPVENSIVLRPFGCSVNVGFGNLEGRCTCIAKIMLVTRILSFRRLLA